ncbi:hypothetical protein K449DRAFT_440667 [Hypoxylon sp. EC38]|nr:hypothetical protein K449DRAFT_440667 [Hypoxylon sp. EC38]
MDVGPPRKRLRRSTRSCYQCRRRKVKCQLTDENVETCAECVKSGTQCTIQPYETELGTGSSPDNESRIESLLKRLVGSLERSPPDDLSAAPTSPWDDSLLRLIADQTLPTADSHDTSIPQPPNMQDAKESLAALLPSTQDAFTIVTNTTAWLWGAETPPGSVLKADDTFRLLDVAAVSRGSAMHIAKTLLLFALYMQQLPANLHGQFLGPQSVERSIELIVERVKLFTISHEDEFFSLDGVECLTLLSLIHLNNDAIRKAWMTFRRLLDIARLQGLQDSFCLSARNSSSSDIGLRRRLWLSIVCGDCYCSLLLGLEPGLGIAPFGSDDEWNDPSAEDDANILRRICLIAARVAQRNAVGLCQEQHTLQKIDEALNRLQHSMPSSWWRPPSFNPDRPLHSIDEPNRLICQLWFFQTRIFAHLPIALGKYTPDSFNSLESCMEASRITLHRYLGLQRARDHLSRCRSVDRSAFLAAVVLLLSKVQLRQHKMLSTASSYDSDQALLEQVTDSFEAVAGIFFSPETASEGTPNTTKYGMEDIIASSIQPALDVQSLASLLINMLLSGKQSTRAMPKRNQDSADTHIELALDGLVDPAVLQ